MKNRDKRATPYKEMRGPWVEILPETGCVRWEHLRRAGDIYVRLKGPIELRSGRYTIAFFVDGEPVLQLPLEVQDPGWLITSFWDAVPASAPNAPARGMRVYSAPIADFELNESEVL